MGAEALSEGSCVVVSTIYKLVTLFLRGRYQDETIVCTDPYANYTGFYIMLWAR